MATSTWSVNTLNNSDATFRAWGQGISTALAAIGLVKTSDTGQVNWATVTLPGTGVYGGYEMWRFDDTLQATYPLFVKVEYGTGSTATRHRVQMTLGKGSNGSGTLTSPFGTALVCQAAANGTATVWNWYASSGDGSALSLVGAPEFSGFSFGLFVERSRDPEGAPTGQGVFAVTAQGTLAYVFNYASGALSPVNSTAYPFRPPASGGLTAGGAAPVFPLVVFDGLGGSWQPTCLLNAMGTDVPTLSPISVPAFGTYLPMPASTFGWAGGTVVSALVRWS